jgi:hypothetical protein
MKVSEMYVEIGAKIDKLESALNRMEGDIKNTGKRAESASRDSFGKIGGIIAGAFSVQAIMGFTKQILAARGEFERFGAVLTNTLGSSSAAQAALTDITKFAAQTPFAVNELTGAFVKLSNQGFRPTLTEMQKLGDIASSTGKDFDQLAEAIIDAQVGEFERLKEFGIRAQKEGDRVKFTFKGVATEVAYTEQAMRAYILSLGDLQGVSGSMDAISQTLEGRISNLGDAWNSFLVTLGDSSAYKTAIQGLTNIITAVDESLKRMDFHEALARDIPALMADGFLNIDDAGVGDFNPLKIMLLDDAGNLRGMDDVEEAIKKNAATLVPLIMKAKEAQQAYIESLANVSSGGDGSGGGGGRMAPTKEEIERWHALGEAAYLAAQITEDAFGASAIDISGPIVEMDKLADPEMAEALSRMSVELEDVTEKLKTYYGELERANMAGELFGSVLNSAFEAALINGESFFEAFGNGLKQLIQQLAVAAATSLVLSAILSTFMPGIGFGKIFGQVSGGMGGSGGTLGGIFKLFGTDLVASGDRTTGQQGRF